MERALLEALVEEVAQGRRADTGFKNVSFERAKLSVQRVDPLQLVGTNHCKSKHDNMKKDWKIWTNLINQSGFSLDEHGRVTGDEGALATYARKHPEAAKFIRTPIRNQDIGHIVFDKGTAVGERLNSVADLRVARTAEGMIIETSPRGKKPASGSSLSSAKRSREDGGLYCSIMDLTSEISMAKHLATGSVKSVALSHFHQHFSMLPSRVKLGVVQLFDNDFNSRNFGLMPVEMKKLWVRDQILELSEELGQHDIDAAEVVAGWEWEGDGEIQRKPYTDVYGSDFSVPDSQY
jgi:hypothetical protein